jgi:ATP-binding cassette subfamily C (CFTR/MRP) protein 1
VSIARAIYKQSDLILLDDPLAAVDAHVGSAIFNRCFKKHCKGKTVVLVTNAQQYLPFVDRIIVIDDGRIVEMGSYDELAEIGGFFAEKYLTELKRRESEASAAVQAAAGEDDAEAGAGEEEEEEKKDQSKPTQIIEAEDRERGKVSWRVYKLYMDYCGGLKLLIASIILMVGWQAASMWSNFIIADWSDASPAKQRRDRDYYIILFCSVSMTINLFVLLRMLIIFCSGLKAARIIFNKCLRALLDAPINKYYDVTPIGRILNRISKDQASIDTGVYLSLGALIGNTFSVLFFVSMCIAVVPWSVLAIPVIIFIASRLQKAYLASSRELTRIASIALSPLIQNFSESM